ncbi:MAG: hypothetical protein KA205_02030, partial [Acidobacteria bacterium]|nr:hypothetical protein [Acidobacteriota bacterium]
MAEGILIAVERAEVLRRRRVLTRLMLRVVPFVAGSLLVAAALIRLTHLSPMIFWTLLALAAIGVAVFAWINGRVPAVTDASAAQLDADAALRGELRSAHWFATHPDGDAWTAFHLQGAAERVERISWPSVYPPVPVARVWVVSSLVALSAIVVVLSSAWPSARRAAGAAREGGEVAADIRPTSVLPPDLQKQLDDLIAAVQRGEIPMDTARAKAAELRDQLAKLDPALQNAMAKAMKEKPGGVETKMVDDPAAAKLAEKAAKAAATADIPQDMKWSMEDLAAKLEKASQRSSDTGEKNSAGEKGEKGAGEKADASAQKGQSAEDAEKSGMQVTRTAAADSQSNQMMASTASPMAGDARGGTGEGPKGKL